MITIVLKNLSKRKIFKKGFQKNFEVFFFKFLRKRFQIFSKVFFASETLYKASITIFFLKKIYVFN